MKVVTSRITGARGLVPRFSEEFLEPAKNLADGVAAADWRGK